MGPLCPCPNSKKPMKKSVCVVFSSLAHNPENSPVQLFALTSTKKSSQPGAD
ncbi:unnamed protein product [Staurois parvus]|uniref:Uncharacterized protein n=1 Tax=Staurois parvus TaxID=386267 RepID=A0ABN9FKY0_9NEOB|nr:unnamed protein product [Staurois parvus]